MEVSYHPEVQRDLSEALNWYDERSDRAGDQFFDEFESIISQILERPLIGFPIDEFSRRVLFKKFPYTLTYEVTESLIYVFVVKHQKRHPNVGMRRDRPSNQNK